MKAVYQRASDAFDGWRDDILSGKLPVRWPVGRGELARLELGPGLVTLIGGAPGAGKTAMVMQVVFDALRLTPELRAVVCNVEMSPRVLLDRQLARLSGVNLKSIQTRQIGSDEAERIHDGLATIESLVDRLAFVRPPFDLENIAATVDHFEGDLVLLDYIQRIASPGDHGDSRSSVNATMRYLRQFSEAGCAVLVVAAVARVKDKKGQSSYSGDALNLASFRESSELEFGADDAYILAPGEASSVTMKHLKSRHGEMLDLKLTFNGRLQRFTDEPNPNAWNPHPESDDEGYS